LFFKVLVGRDFGQNASARKWIARCEIKNPFSEMAYRIFLPPKRAVSDAVSRNNLRSACGAGGGIILPSKMQFVTIWQLPEIRPPKFAWR
jgi:hypothetical protein